MEDLLRPIYQERAADADTLGVVLIEKTKPNSPITDNFDVILLIVVQHAAVDWQVKHYAFNEKSAAMHTVTDQLLHEWIDKSKYRKAIEWIENGKTIFDRNNYLQTLRDQLRSFPHDKRDLRKAMEFGKLIKRFSESKDLYASGQYKDAYSSMILSLHYLARLAIIEKGYHPEITVWSQVKKIDAEVYRLYDELIQSEEELPKRIQLMIFAADFAISTRAKVSAKHLLDIMSVSGEAWSFDALKQHENMKSYELDLAAMLVYLTEKDLLQTELVETKGKGVFERRYKVR